MEILRFTNGQLQEKLIKEENIHDRSVLFIIHIVIMEPEYRSELNRQ